MDLKIDLKNKISSRLVKLLAVFAVFSTPLVSSAVFERTVEFLFAVRWIIDFLIPMTVALALLFFFWGLAKFILHADNEDARAGGKQIMVWGIVALFVAISIWGIVYFIQRELGIGAYSEPVGFPQLPI